MRAFSKIICFLRDLAFCGSACLRNQNPRITSTTSVTIMNGLPPNPVASMSEGNDAEESSRPRKRPRTQAMPQVTAAKSESPITSTLPDFHRFSIQPLSRFQGASASIKRPCEVAHFSYDEHHVYKDDGSSMSYYHPPQLGTNLCDGFDTFHHYEDATNPHLDSLLKALIHSEKSDTSSEKLTADFVTWRGMMTKLMTCPYDKFAEFSMYATLFDGTVYIEEDFPLRAAQRATESSPVPAAKNHQNRHPNQHSHEMMTYWGYKFETLSLLPTPPSQTPRDVITNRTRARVSNHAQYCSVVRTSFGAHTLLLGGEVDGLDSPKPPPPSSTTTNSSSTAIPWIELKTSESLSLRPNTPPHPSSILKFERKMLKFWAQSFLLGVPKIIIGWRSREGVLEGLQEMETHAIPGMVRRGTKCWDGNVCLKWVEGLLGWLREVVKEEGAVWRVRLGKGRGVVECERVRGGDREHSGIVSREFTEWRARDKTKTEAERNGTNRESVDAAASVA